MRISGFAARLGTALAIEVVAAGMAPMTRAATVAGVVAIVERDGARGDPSSAVVWIEGAPGPPPSPERAAITMRGKAFEPAVLSLPVGSRLAFPNADPILHNVFSVSADNQFDLGLYPRGPGREVVLRSPGIVRVFCNVHPQMEALVVVTPGRWVARPAADGRFSISDVPDGRYTVRVWHERGGSGESQVELTAGNVPEVEIRLDASAWRRRPHLDKNGRPYQGAQGATRDPY
ncbi:MAG TPA: carboxypeptidase regulatory-like domain-containing protein [Candidatus Cryosericum sp.]|nr:carboxypeptidase regulatory-like domain-containing protein [Candidatus Cryosericum sp.]